MTRKQALLKAINDCNDPAVKEKLIDIYHEIPITHWTKKSIIDAIENYYLETGKYPTSSILNRDSALPYYQVIENVFGIKVKDFLNLYFPHDKTEEQLKEECNNRIIHDFIIEYNRIKPSSIRDYNKRRNKKVQCSATVCKAANSKWNELLKKLKLQKYKNGKPISNMVIASDITIMYNGKEI